MTKTEEIIKMNFEEAIEKLIEDYEVMTGRSVVEVEHSIASDGKKRAHLVNIECE